MACGGCGNKNANIKYEVNFGPGGPASQRYDTAAEARRAIVAAGKPTGATFKPVSA